ncbi:MAG: metal-dependent hydrolase [Agitococcus sp.]
MFIAHLPVGYLVSRHLLSFVSIKKYSQARLWLAALCGSVAPDFDLLYFYLIDNQQHHHHQYWSHLPICWLGLVLMSTLLLKKTTNALYLLFFSINGFIHLLLDTVVGDIWWLYPLVNKPFALFDVEAHFQPWWLNFIYHWSFLLELSLCCWAWFIWRHNHPKSLK